MAAKPRKIECIGGPKEGTYRYPSPLPKSVVFQANPMEPQEVYYRKPNTTTYIHADELEYQSLMESLGLGD